MIRTLAGLAPFQLAFVVHDLETAAQRFDAVLGAGPWRGYLFDETAVGGRLYHGRPADWSLRLALNDTRPQYELIQPIAGPSIHAEWLQQHGEGFHHVAYIVESIDAVVAEMRDAGHIPVMEVHSFGVDGDGRGVYFDTVDAIGCFVEAVEPPARMPHPSFALAATRHPSSPAPGPAFTARRASPQRRSGSRPARSGGLGRGRQTIGGGS